MACDLGHSWPDRHHLDIILAGREGFMSPMEFPTPISYTGSINHSSDRILFNNQVALCVPDIHNDCVFAVIDRTHPIWLLDLIQAANHQLTRAAVIEVIKSHVRVESFRTHRRGTTNGCISDCGNHTILGR